MSTQVLPSLLESEYCCVPTALIRDGEYAEAVTAGMDTCATTAIAVAKATSPRRRTELSTADMCSLF